MVRYSSLFPNAMPTPRLRSFRLGLMTAILLLAAVPGLAKLEFTPVSASERALAEVPGHPNSPAVVLFEKAKVSLLDYPNSVSSSYQIAVRIKILTDEGVQQYGELEIGHSRFLRLRDFQGRTILPDGRVLPLSDDAIFQQTRSKSEKVFVTKAAFPGLAVGAIIDYVYELAWGSIYFSEPWLFHNDVPTLLSEITYSVPAELEVVTWARQTTPQKMQVEHSRSRGGRSMRVWIENLPPIPDEPSSYPAKDLSSRMMILPKAYRGSTSRLLLDNWRSACDLFSEEYRPFSKKSSQAKKKAQALTAESASAKQRLETLYRFVRDEIQTETYWSIEVDAKDTADKVLQGGQGTPAEQALLLQAMLGAVGLEADILWASNRFEGMTDLSVANPGWFDRVLVRTELERGHVVYLDPTDRTLALGQLTPGTEGTQAVVFHTRKPEVITLPQSTAENNTRQADLRLRLDDHGRLSGEGSILYSGQHAWVRIEADSDAEDEKNDWIESLEDSFPGFEIRELTLETSVDDQRLRIDWSFEQLDEEVLGDETSLTLARPFGPSSQRFQLTPGQRLTPVQLSFADSTSLKVEVRWPEGWGVDVAPRPHQAATGAGRFESTVQIDETARKMHFQRQFTIAGRDFATPEPYNALRDLYTQAEKSDAEALVLVAH